MLVKRFSVVVGLALVAQLACMPGDAPDAGVAKAIGNEERRRRVVAPSRGRVGTFRSKHSVPSSESTFR